MGRKENIETEMGRKENIETDMGRKENIETEMGRKENIETEMARKENTDTEMWQPGNGIMELLRKRASFFKRAKNELREETLEKLLYMEGRTPDDITRKYMTTKD